MADVPVGLPSGTGGSREKFAKLATYIGAGITGFGAFLAALQAANHEASWIPVAVMVLGVATKLGAWLGYFKSETDLKKTAMQEGLVAGAAVQTPGQAAAVLRSPPP